MTTTNGCGRWVRTSTIEDSGPRSPSVASLADDKKPGAPAGNGRKTQVRILAARFARGLSERFALLTLVIPAKAGIQYAAAHRFHHWRLPSLRANGSRERAPDDRLREAIHGSARKKASKSGLLRRCAPRNDVQPHFRDLAARCARVVQLISALKTEGVGNAGCPMHPQPRVRYW